MHECGLFALLHDSTYTKGDNIAKTRLLLLEGYAAPTKAGKSKGRF